MPLYDYQCAQCGPFTELRPMAECEAPSACPGCGCCAKQSSPGAKGFVGRRPWMISH
jgi:putative FmdB family regulatory protein